MMMNKKASKLASAITNSLTIIFLLPGGVVAMVDKRSDEIVDDLLTVLDEHGLAFSDGALQRQDNVRVRPVGSST
jgi:hypothetical protein